MRSLLHSCFVFFRAFALAACCALAQAAMAAEAALGVAQVRQVPAVNGGGTVEGSIHMMSGGSITLNGGATITRDLLVPGTPVVRTNGKPNFGGTLDGSGPATPSGYTITLNGQSTLRNVIRRTAPLVLPAVATPPAPAGSRDVTLNSAAQPVGAWATLRNLTLNGNAGQIAVPPGTYGDFIANGGSGFTIGISGATTPSVYNLQRLTVNGQARVDVVGPVVLNLANGLAANGVLGASARPDWLALNIAAGGLALNGGCTIHAFVNAPAAGTGTVIINGNSALVGGLVADKLIVNGGGVLRLRQGGGTGPVNTAPVANSQSLSTPEDTPLSLTLVATDAENDPLTYHIVSVPTPTSGSFRVAGSSDAQFALQAGAELLSTALLYVPASNSTEPVELKFRARDTAGLDSNLATVSIAVTPVNDLPVAAPIPVRTLEDTPVAITLSGADTDGSIVAYSVEAVTAEGVPLKGSLTGEPPALTYRPEANFFGEETFAYTVTDDQGGVSARASVTVVVEPVNDAPVAFPGEATTDEDQPVVITLSASDIDGDTLQYLPAEPPEKGSVAITGNLATFSPAPDSHGTFTFTFTAFDGSASSAPATVTVTVNPRNDAPSATPLPPQTTPEDTPIEITLSGSDVDDEPLRLLVADGPSLGSLTLLDGTAIPASGAPVPASGLTLRYSPAPDRHGADDFSFIIADSSGAQSPTAIVPITVTPVNDAPVARPTGATTPEDKAVNIELLGTDVDSPTLEWRVVRAPLLGSVVITGNVAAYTPNPDANGPDAFSVHATDGTAFSGEVDVAVTIIPVDDLPTATGQTLTLAEDTPTAISLAGTSSVGAPLAYRLVSQPGHGTLTGSANALTYTPAPHFNGADNFTFTVTDGVGTSEPAIVSLEVTPANDAPVAFPFTARTSRGRPITVLLAGADPEQSDLTLSAPSSTPHGTLSEVAGEWIYTPSADFTGTDDFPFTVSDGELSSAPATVTVVVSPDNAPPSVSAGEDQVVALNEGGVALNGFASDDGLPVAGRLVHVWTQADGPAETRIVAGEQLDTPVHFSRAGVYKLRLSANDGILSAFDDVVVNVVDNGRPRITSQPLTRFSFPLDQDASSELVMTVRDFSDTHIDFESASGFGGKPAVAERLGEDGKPVFVGPDGFGWIASAESFHQWFHDVPGVNQTAEVRLPLAPRADNPSVLRYESTNFFPIDNRLGGNEGRNNNFHFTAEWHSIFVYRGGEVLSFSGDDDVWVFIDGRRVIDLGGIHPEENASVALDTLGLVRGRTYPIDLFFAERQTSSSNFILETTLVLTGGGTYVYDLQAEDPEGGLLSYRLVTAPAGMSIDPVSGRITWSVGPQHIGETDVVVEVSDSAGLTATQAYTLIVAANEPPIIAAPGFVDARTTQPVTLSGHVQDDGQPVGSDVDVQWAPVLPSPAISISSPNEAETLATFSVPGVYQLKFSATDSELGATATTTVRVADACDPLPAGVVAWWPLNGDLVDLLSRRMMSGKSSFGAGQVGLALDCGNVDRGIVTTDRTDLDLAAGTGFTVEHWFDPLLQEEDGQYRGKSGVLWGWGGYSDSGVNARVTHRGALEYQISLDLRYVNGENLWLDLDTHVALGFNHLAVTYDPAGARVRVYLNGVFLGERTDLTMRLRTEAAFALSWPHGGNGFRGLLDEVALYDRALSDAEIAGIVALGRSGKCPAGINRAPVVRTGTYRTALLGAVETLPTTVSDDGLPLDIAPVLNWTVLSEPAPGSVLFDDISSAAPRVVFGAVGTYKLRLTADDGELESFDDLTVLVVAPDNQAPQVNVGDDLALSLDRSLRLSPTISDDDQPAGGVFAYAWSVVSGPAPVVWGDTAARNTTVAFQATGTYVLRLEVNDGELAGADQVVVTVTDAVNAAPSVDLGADFSVKFGESFTPPTLVISDDGLPADTLSYQWARISGPPAVSFGDATRADSSLGFSAPGIYVLRLTVSDGALSGHDEIQITVRPGDNQPPAVNVGPDVALPLNGILHVEASMVDDGQPLGRTLAYSWRQLDFTPALSGDPAGAAMIAPDPLDPANPLKRQLTFDRAGVYRIELSVTEWLDGAPVRVGSADSAGRDELTVTVDVPANAAPYVNVGDDITIPLNATLRVPAVVSNDDGLPAGAVLTASWSKRSGPGAVEFNPAPEARDQFDTAIAFRAQGTYVLRLTASDGDRSAYDELTVIVGPEGNAAPQVSLGADLEFSRDTVLHARPVVQDDGLPAGGALAFSWTELSAPAGGAVTFGDATSRDTALSFSAIGTYVVRLTASDGALSGQDELTLRVTSPLNRAPVVAAGADIALSENQTLVLNGAASDDDLPLNPGRLTYLWQVVPATDAAYVGFVDESGLPIAPDGLVQRVRFSRSGTYTLRLTANDGELVSEPDDVVVTVGPRANQPPRISAPAAITVGPGVARVFPFSVTDDGLPAGGDLTYRWTQTDASGFAVVFGNRDAADCTLLFPVPGAYTIALTVTEGADGAGGLFATHTYQVAVEAAPNQAPLVAAALGSDSAFAGQPASLVAAALDDGQPVGAPLSRAWTQVSGPAAAAFADASALETSVTFPAAGAYVLRLSVSDSQLTGTADVAVTVSPVVNQPPTVSLPPPFAAALGSASTVRTAVADDGLPAGSVLSYAWSVTSDRSDNTRGVVFGTPSSAETAATFVQPGAYTLTLTVFDGDLSTAASTTVTVAGTRNQAPTLVATFPPTRVIQGSNELYADGVASDPDGDAVAVDFVATGPAPATAERRVTDTTAPFVADFGDLAPGAYTFYAVARDPLGASAETPRFGVTVIPADASIEGSVSIVAPVADDTITAPVAVTGFAQDPDFASYRLQYRAASETAAPWIDFASADSPAGSGSTAGALGTFDPGLLRNGLYDLRLVLATRSGTELVSDSVRVTVDGRRKVGVFSVAFRDLSLPFAGIPVEIIRSYDTRDRATPGDFGHGWKLGVNSVKVRKNRALGRDWLLDVQTFDAFSSTYYLYTLDPDTPPSGARPVKHLVTLSFPDDTLQTFEAYLDVQTGTGADGTAVLASMLFGLDLDANQSFTLPITQARIRFRPANARTRGTLELVDTAPAWLVDGAASGSVQLRGDYDPDAPVFDATRFRYTADDGTVYLLDERDGLESIADLQGNRLELVRDSATGRVSQITHKAAGTTDGAPDPARSVVINRDSTGRIESLRDPYGSYIDYVYDRHGDLQGVLDRAGAFTSYEYYTGSIAPADAHLAHYLKNIVDPRGTLALRNEYDDDGRLVAQFDATGAAVEFVRDEANVEKIVDRLGNATRHQYDDQGNVLQTTRPDGSVLSYTYNEAGDVLSQTDPLGHVTRYTYDSSGRVLTQTDPLGRTTSTTYDERGNPLTVVDALGHATTSEYHPADASRGARGQPAKLIDARQNETRFLSYDPRGNLLVLQDASGVQTHSTYDGQDRLLTQTVGYRSASEPGVTTTYAYDDFGRVESETRTATRADLSIQTLVTRYAYDGEGRVTFTYLPGHTDDAPRFSHTEYDENGKPVTSTDELGRVTTHEYDDRGDLVRTTYPPVTIGTDDSGAPLKAAYTEEFAYDAESRRILAKDRAGRWTRACYDVLGRVIASYQLDADVVDRALAIAATPGSGTLLSATRYDLAGRVTDNYDAQGNRTAYAYDAAGRRTRVTPPGALPAQFTVNADGDALVFTRDGDLDSARATVTTYDEAGNVATVTDARGNTTRYLYDQLNRRTETIFPDQTRQREVYDALGRRVESVDAEGRITRYGYDELGRLKSVTDARQQTTSYGYDEAGRQTTQTDALGRVTRHAYDEQGRRVSRTLPDGSVERFTYDLAGNLETRKDFLGRTTTFTYDELNRLVAKTADPLHPSRAYSHAIVRVEYDYDANGRREAARTYNAAGDLLYVEDTPRDERGRIDYKDTGGAVLDYDYHANDLLKEVVSDTEGGVNVGYRYDASGRLAYVDDASGDQTVLTTSYAYNPVGSLDSVATPNGLAHAYGYDSLNRLTSTTVRHGTAQTVRSYVYTLTPSGRRSNATEFTGRAVAYAYDATYRLTSETISGAGAQNGAVGYTLDAVGNRLARTSTVPALSTTANSYSVRDWLNTDTYDANGNTTVGQTAGLASSPASPDIYDFEDRLIVRTRSDLSKVYLAYDADGIRIGKTILNASSQLVSSTSYLVCANNLTGYAQVLEETTTDSDGTTLKAYAYGHDLLSVSTQAPGSLLPAPRSFYVYDGGGSVRALTDETGAITDTWDYDAFGNLIGRTGRSDNAHLYRGEQYDADLGHYYLRARFYNQGSGRFWNQDTYEGSNSDPASLHKYLYAHADPVNGIDPSGNVTLNEVMIAVHVGSILYNAASLSMHLVGAATAPTTEQRQEQLYHATVDMVGLLIAFSGGGPMSLAPRLATSGTVSIGVQFVAQPARALGSVLVPQGVLIMNATGGDNSSSGSGGSGSSSGGSSGYKIPVQPGKTYIGAMYNSGKLVRGSVADATKHFHADMLKPTEAFAFTVGKTADGKLIVSGSGTYGPITEAQKNMVRAVFN